jgi:NTE family protein
LLLLGSGLALRAQKVRVVLSSGGAKGLAHIGVLKQLDANGISIDYIIGTSMGAVVGAIYSAGYSPH